jgi:hypothetical protein
MNIRLEPWSNLSDQQKVEKHYLISLESASLIDALVASGGDKQEVKRNVDHLKIMVLKDFWNGQDLAPLNEAISAGEEYVNE